MTKLDIKLTAVAEVIKNLPSAFKYMYWGLANTTYKEEIALVAIEQNKLKPERAKKFLRQCKLYKKDYPILYWLIDGLIAEGNGAHYGLTPEGDKLIKAFITRTS